MLKYSFKLNKQIGLRLLSDFRPPKLAHASALMNIQSDQYQAIQNKLCAIIEQKAGPSYFFMDKKSINPLPMLISTSQISEYKRIQEALSCAIQCVVLNYFKDKRIQSALSLNNRVKNILELYKNKQFYQIGSYRYNIS